MKRVLAVCVLILFPVLLSAQSLSLLWENTTFRGSQNTAQSVDAIRNRVVVGELLDQNVTNSAAVKGFNATTGHLVWTDERTDGLYGWIQVKTAGDLAVAALQHLIPPPAGIGQATVELILRAYDVRTGDIRWTRTTTTLSNPQQMLIRNGRIAVIGYSAATDPLTGVIIVDDLATGVELWRVDDIQPPILPLQDTIFWDLDDAGRNLVVVGTVGPSLPRETHIRSYRFTDGHLRWEKVIPSIGAIQVQVLNGRAYIAGHSTVVFDGYLAAFSIADGSTAWELSVPNEGFFSSLLVTPTQVIAGSPFSIRAYDISTQALRWSRPFVEEESITTRILPLGRFLLTVRQINKPPFGPAHFLLTLLTTDGDTLSDIAGIDSTLVRDAIFLNGKLAVSGSSPAGAFIRVYTLEVAP